MNAYWRYYEEEQIANGVKVKRPELIISGKVNGGYKILSGGSDHLIDLRKASSGQEIADYLRRYASAKRNDPSVKRPYLHDFIDMDTNFGNLGDKTGFGGMSTERSGFRNINGNLVEVKIIPREAFSNGYWSYDPNTTDNQVGGYGFKEYKVGQRIYSEAYYNNRSGSGLIVFTLRDQRTAAMQLYKYIIDQ